MRRIRGKRSMCVMDVSIEAFFSLGILDEGKVEGRWSVNGMGGVRGAMGDAFTFYTREPVQR